MKLTPRDYQQAAHDAIFKRWIAGERTAGNPAVELATGLGKSILVAMTCQTILTRWPNARVQMLVHNRELVRQNYEELKELWPEAPVGIYSAGLNSRDTEQPIIFSSIQSVYRRVDELGPRHFNLCDECHLVPVDGNGMYQQYFNEMGLQTGGRMRVIGYTATPYRMDSGGIAEPSDDVDKLFEEIVYRYGIGEGTRDGWLCPLTAKAGATEIDVARVQRRGGEFVAGALQAAANEAGLVERTVEDLIGRARAAGRNSWLIFCSGVAHAEAVADMLNERGVPTRSITGKMAKGERDHLIEQFKRGELQALTNAEVLTTGFNAPGVDLIALLRPTLSTALYVQMMGRGTRVLKGVNINGAADADERRALIAASGKPNCLVLDYAGNVRRHGPVDTVNVEEKQGRDNEAEQGELIKVNHDDIRAKQCDDCGTLNWTGAVTCVDCGFEFKEMANHDDTPDEDIAVLSDEVVPEAMDVHSWDCNIHTKPGSPDMLRVAYRAGVSVYYEYWCFEHRGRARHKAYMNWMRHTGGATPPPTTSVQALARFDELVMPRQITPVREGKFWRVTKKNFASEDFRAGANMRGINAEQWDVPRGRFPGINDRN